MSQETKPVVKNPFSSLSSSSISSSSLAVPTASPLKLETKSQDSAINLEGSSSESQAFFEQLSAAVSRGNAEEIEALIKKGLPQLEAKIIANLRGALVALHKAGILTSANCQALLDHAEHAWSLGDGLSALKQAGILTPENRQVLLDLAQHAWSLGRGLSALKQAGILTPENRQVLLDHAQHAWGLGEGLSSLHAAGLLTLKNFMALLDHAEHAAGLERGLSSLHAAGILTLENFMALLGHAEHAEDLGGGLVDLRGSGILTPENFMALLDDVEHAAGLGQGLAFLGAAGILTPENRQALLDHAEHAGGLGLGLTGLQEAGALTPENRQALLDHAEHAGGLGLGLTGLQEAGILTQENFIALLDRAEHAKDLADELQSLEWEKRLTQETFNALLERFPVIESSQKTASLQEVGTSSSQIREPLLESKQQLSTKSEASSSSSQTTSQATIQNIQDDLSQGNVEALLNQLKQPAGTIATGSEMDNYLKQQALMDIVKAQAEGSEKAELKDSQRANLIQAMEEVLKAAPAAVTQPNKAEGGLTPLDLAIQLDLPKDIITKLQQAEQEEYDRQTIALQQKLEKLSQGSQDPQKPKLDAESKALCAELVPLVTNTIEDLKKVRAQLSQTQSASTSVSSNPVLIPIAGATVSLVNAPVSLSAAQEAQIALGQQLLNIKLTQVFTKALAIKYKLVDGHNQSRAGAVAEGGFKLVADLLPVPGAGLIAKSVVVVVKKAVEIGTKKAVEKRDVKRQDRRIGEVSTIDQAAERVAALVRNLTRRFQLVFAQLQPDSLGIFVDQIVDRMVHYWDAIPEKLKKAGVEGEVLKERLVDCTQPLSVSPSSSSVSALSESQQFDNLMENMLLGTSLWKDREAKASGRIAKSSGRKGFLGKIAGVVVGDRLVTLQGLQGSQDVVVQQICHHAPPVTWTGVNHHQNDPVYYYGDPAANVDLAVDQNLPPLYLSKEECELRGYTVDQSKPAPLSLLIAPKELDLNDAQRKERELEAEIMRLRQQLGVAEARADKEKARADTAEATLEQVKEAKAMSAPQKLPVSEAKEISIPRTPPASLQPKWTPRAVGQIPVSPSSPGEPPDKSLSTQADSTLTPMSPMVTS